MRLADIIGHRPAVRLLQRVLARGEDTGTFLIVGEAGIGKNTLARAFAMAAACLSPNQDPFDACGQCASCRRALAGSHPEIVTVPPAGEQTQIWQFWDREGKPPGVLQRAVGFAPVVGRKRVFIVERADTLTEAAANSLLKVLEEPPPYVLFILLAVHASRLLPTVVSRARMLRLSLVASEELAAGLQRAASVPIDQARILAAASGGRPGVALCMAAREGTSEEIDLVMDWVASVTAAPALAAPQLADALRRLAGHSRGAPPEPAEAAGDEQTGSDRLQRGSAAAILDIAAILYRDLAAASLAGAADGLISQKPRARILELARTAPPAVWLSCLDAVLKGRRMLDQNVSVRLVLEALTMEVANATGARAPAYGA